MRGIAALIVLFHHFTHMYFPAAIFGTNWRTALLYPFIAGHESVMFFFLLSGFVLALPFLGGRSQPYPIFLWRRILRIYGPYLMALALAVAGCSIWHNRLGASGWAAGTWNAPVNFRLVAEHILFIGNYNYAEFNTAFWSLVYEMRISIIYPLLFLAANRLRLRYSLLVVILLTIVGAEMSGSQTLITLEYAGTFLIGILLAKHRTDLTRIYRRISVWQRVVFAVAALLLYNEGHLLSAYGPIWHLGSMPVILGAAGFIIIGLNSAAASNVLHSAVPAFLGRISYSLYLVHGTVLFALAAMLRGKVSPPAFLLLYLPTAIFLSWGFYYVVEAPFTRASRNVGRRVAEPAVVKSQSIAG
jgi:peptidoglycan/LPS O-acetylase OafA/YrhL